MERLTTEELVRIRRKSDTATEAGLGSSADNYAQISSRKDIPRLLTEVETLITEKADARRKLDAASGILLEYQRTGVHVISTEVVAELLDHVRKELVDNGE